MTSLRRKKLKWLRYCKRHGRSNVWVHGTYMDKKVTRMLRRMMKRIAPYAEGLTKKYTVYGNLSSPPACDTACTIEWKDIRDAYGVKE